jgi:hypothetical protein
MRTGLREKRQITDNVYVVKGGGGGLVEDRTRERFQTKQSKK